MTKTEKKRDLGGRRPGAWTAVQPEQIRAFRDAHEISRARFAAALRVSSTTIQNWETGMWVAEPETQEKLAEMLETGPEAFPSAIRRQPTVAVGPQLTAAAEIVAGYLKVQERKLSTEELLELIRSVRSALS